MQHPRQAYAFILDMDGVLWRGEASLPGVGEFFDLLRRLGKSFILATNNAMTTPDRIVDRLAGAGARIGLQDVLTSAQATAAYLRKQLPAGAPLFVIGEEGLQQALQQAGFTLLDQGAGAAAVVAGMDRKATWEKLAQASLAIGKGAAFFGTNPDRSFPVEGGFVPGAGALLAAVQAATGVAPQVIGKPETPLFLEAIERLKSQPSQTLVVGDRLETDILGGQRAGMQTILILTGVTSRDMLARSMIQPDWVYHDLPALTRALGEGGA
jgi:4-nitrophenyl phosphatase